MILMAKRHRDVFAKRRLLEHEATLKLLASILADTGRYSESVQGEIRRNVKKMSIDDLSSIVAQGNDSKG